MGRGASAQPRRPPTASRTPGPAASAWWSAPSPRPCPAGMAPNAAAGGGTPRDALGHRGPPLALGLSWFTGPEHGVGWLSRSEAEPWMFVHRMKTRSTFGVPRPTSGSPTSSPGRTAPASAPLQTTAVAEGPGTPGDQGLEVSPAFLKFSSHDPLAPPPRLAKGGACTALTPQSSPGKPSRGGGGVSPSSRAPRQWRRRAPALAGAVGPPARPCHGCRVRAAPGTRVPGGVSRPADPSPSTAVTTRASWVGSAPQGPRGRGPGRRMSLCSATPGHAVFRVLANPRCPRACPPGHRTLPLLHSEVARAGAAARGPTPRVGPRSRGGDGKGCWPKRPFPLAQFGSDAAFGTRRCPEPPEPGTCAGEWGAWAWGAWAWGSRRRRRHETVISPLNGTVSS